MGENIWNEWQKHPKKNDIAIGPRIQHVYDILRQDCSQIKAKRQIRKQFYMSCKNIDLPQQYGCHKKNKHKKIYKNKYKSYKPYKQHKNFSIRPSRTYMKRKYIPKQFRKRSGRPWIRKYKAPKDKSSCKCYLCGEVGHIRPKCPKLGKQPREKVHLMELFKLDKDEDIQSIYSLDDLSDNESIYSIESTNTIDPDSEDSSSSNSELEEYMCGKY